MIGRRTVSNVVIRSLMLAAVFVAAAVPSDANARTTAIVGATLIDGNGGPPSRDVTIVVREERIAAIGPRHSVRVPNGARVIDAAGRFVTPGFIDTNVHMSPLRSELSFARYWDRLEQLVLQGAQEQLKHGVTTIRDSYGPLQPEIAVRDRIARGDAIGPRMYVAGNIVGWGGAYSLTMSGTPEKALSFFQERINDLFTQGVGEDLIAMTPDELRVAINAYLDRGVNFIKYGGSTENGPPYLMLFSPRQQAVIVEETHRRSLVAEAHAKGLEPLRLSILAGIDLIQHPEAVGTRELTVELLELIVRKQVICSMLPNKYTGEVWARAMRQQDEARRSHEAMRLQGKRRIPPTSAEVRREIGETGVPRADSIHLEDLRVRRANAKKLIQAGCIVSVGADNLLFGRADDAPEFLRENSPTAHHLMPGTGTLAAIEGLVELGMSPNEAIVSATRNGALACKALREFGTVEVGKVADLLILSADPLQSISNIRRLELVLARGRVVDPQTLPIVRITGDW